MSVREWVEWSRTQHRWGVYSILGVAAMCVAACVWVNADLDTVMSGSPAYRSWALWSLLAAISSVTGFALIRKSHPTKQMWRHIGVAPYRLPVRMAKLHPILLSVARGIPLVVVVAVFFVALPADTAGMSAALPGLAASLLLGAVVARRAMKQRPNGLTVRPDRLERYARGALTRLQLCDLASAELEIEQRFDGTHGCRLRLTPTDPEVETMFIWWHDIPERSWPVLMDIIAQGAGPSVLGPLASKVSQGYVFAYSYPGLLAQLQEVRYRKSWHYRMLELEVPGHGRRCNGRSAGADEGRHR